MMDRRSPARMDRRSVLRGASALTTAGLAGLAGCLGGDGGGDGPDQGGFQSYVSGAKGDTTPVDRRDADEITVVVGAGDQGVAFDPVAVRASQGVTVNWEWTGNGGSHNVVSENDLFRSKLSASANFEFTRTLDQVGVYKYYCGPHEAIGMVGAIKTV